MTEKKKYHARRKPFAFNQICTENQVQKFGKRNRKQIIF